MTIVYDNYVFHYVVENGICYLCMSDELNKHRIPYAFLSDIKDRFLAQYGHEAPLQAIAFAYNDEFSRIIQDRLDFYNSPEADHSVDNIGAVKSQIEDVKGVMVQNIEKVSFPIENACGVNLLYYYSFYVSWLSNYFSDVWLFLFFFQVLERGEKIELLVDKTDRLNQQAFRFESSSRRLKQAMYWRKVRCYASIAAAVIFLLVIASYSMWPHAKKDNNNN